MSSEIRSQQSARRGASTFRTAEQEKELEYLEREYGITSDQVRWFDSGTAWLTSKALITVAMSSGQVSEIVEGVDRAIPEFNQVSHFARVVTASGMTLQLVGVATLGEALWNGESADAHELAGSRALVSVLDAVGINPLKEARKRGDAVGRVEGNLQEGIYDASARHDAKQIREVHAIAREAGLIRLVDGVESYEAYRDHMRTWSLCTLDREVTSSTDLNEGERASLIASLRDYLGRVRQRG